MPVAKHLLLALGLASILLGVSACSPGYVLRAGWEEAGILLSREPIAEVLQSPETDDEVRAMLFEVQRARAFAQRLGLKPNNSFLYYSEIDRDILLWVISAAPKYSLEFHTWWFPIVGNVPYKGFFEKEDAQQELRALAEKGYDVYMRPSLAFSTLGWFSDPLLSTMKKVDRVSLVDTVFHELLHNTIWLTDHVEFNESMANALGSFAAQHYFTHYYGENHLYTIETRNRWKDQQTYSRFLTRVVKHLRLLYKNTQNASLTEKKAQRREYFDTVALAWRKKKRDFASTLFKRKKFQENNAALLAETIYYSHLPEFNRHYTLAGKDVGIFIDAMRKIVSTSEEESKDPFALLKSRK